MGCVLSNAYLEPLPIPVLDETDVVQAEKLRMGTMDKNSLAKWQQQNPDKDVRDVATLVQISSKDYETLSELQCVNLTDEFSLFKKRDFVCFYIPRESLIGVRRVLFIDNEWHRWVIAAWENNRWTYWSECPNAKVLRIIPLFQ